MLQQRLGSNIGYRSRKPLPMIFLCASFGNMDRLNSALTKVKWHTLENSKLLDTTSLNKHSVSWTPAGRHELRKGTVTIRLEAIEKFGPFVLDCFVLTRVPFLPQGTLKPWENLDSPIKAPWAFEPDIDTFEREDAIGLAALNEDIAGSSGWITCDATGNFLDGKGEPIRFWCVNTNEHRSTDLNLLRMHAKGLAKRGVNMWRQHGRINPGPNQRPDEACQRSRCRRPATGRCDI